MPEAVPLRRLSTPCFELMKTETLTILIISAGLLILAYLFQLIFLVWTGTAILLAGLIFPIARRSIHKIWMTIGLWLGWINSRIVFGAVFYLLLTPIALVSGLFRKDTLKLNPENQSGFYFDRNRSFSHKDLRDPW